MRFVFSHHKYIKRFFVMAKIHKDCHHVHAVTNQGNHPECQHTVVYHEDCHHCNQWGDCHGERYHDCHHHFDDHVKHHDPIHDVKHNTLYDDPINVNVNLGTVSLKSTITIKTVKGNTYKFQLLDFVKKGIDAIFRLQYEKENDSNDVVVDDTLHAKVDLLTNILNEKTEILKQKSEIANDRLSKLIEKNNINTPVLNECSEDIKNIKENVDSINMTSDDNAALINDTFTEIVALKSLLAEVLDELTENKKEDDVDVPGDVTTPDDTTSDDTTSDDTTCENCDCENTCPKPVEGCGCHNNELMAHMMIENAEKDEVNIPLNVLTLLPKTEIFKAVDNMSDEIKNAFLKQLSEQLYANTEPIMKGLYESILDYYTEDEPETPSDEPETPSDEPETSEMPQEYLK